LGTRGMVGREAVLSVAPPLSSQFWSGSSTSLFPTRDAAAASWCSSVVPSNPARSGMSSAPLNCEVGRRFCEHAWLEKLTLGLVGAQRSGWTTSWGGLATLESPCHGQCAGMQIHYRVKVKSCGAMEHAVRVASTVSSWRCSGHRPLRWHSLFRRPTVHPCSLPGPF
jgi:hypothetical protein